MWLLMFATYALLTLFVFPFYTYSRNVILFLYGMFCVTLFVHIYLVCRDPGFIKKPTGVTFMQLLEQFDPIFLCPDCEVVRTDRSRHCTVCG
jgi:hypothetical protein